MFNQELLEVNMIDVSQTHIVLHLSFPVTKSYILCYSQGEEASFPFLILQSLLFAAGLKVEVTKDTWKPLSR